MRKEHLGYQPNEHLSNDELIKEAYKGIRPAPGYPACPDNTEKATLFKLLDHEADYHKAGRSGVFLTEHLSLIHISEPTRPY